MKVSATLWPSHGHVPVEENDFVVLEGKYNQSPGKTKDGDPITYHNLSVSRISVNGSAADPGKKVESEDNDVPADEPADDEIPF